MAGRKLNEIDFILNAKMNSGFHKWKFIQRMEICWVLLRMRILYSGLAA